MATPDNIRGDKVPMVWVDDAGFLDNEGNSVKVASPLRGRTDDSYAFVIANGAIRRIQIDLQREPFSPFNTLNS